MECKACGVWFASTMKTDLCTTCERAMKRLGFGNFSYDRLRELAQDIDRTAALMCYLQLSLLGCAGYVVIADSLRYPITGSLLRPTPAPEQDIWYTPTLYLSSVWGYRMLWEKIESVQRCATSDPKPETMTDIGTQLTLF